MAQLHLREIDTDPPPRAQSLLVEPGSAEVPQYFEKHCQ